MIRSLTKKGRNFTGFTLIEVIVTIFIVTAGFLLLYTVFGLAIRHATQARDKLVAELVADGLVEEFSAHEYGEPLIHRYENKSLGSPWKKINYEGKTAYECKQELLTIIQGRKVRTTYRKIAWFENGSFVGDAKGDIDKIHITIEWIEATGLQASGVKKKYVETMPVRRRLD